MLRGGYALSRAARCSAAMTGHRSGGWPSWGFHGATRVDCGHDGPWPLEDRDEGAGIARAVVDMRFDATSRQTAAAPPRPSLAHIRGARHARTHDAGRGEQTGPGSRPP